VSSEAAGVHVSHMLYANEMTMLTYEPHAVQTMLNRLCTPE